MPASHKTVVLSIAGSDPSGGAGIQADLKTFTALGVYGGAAITCLTVQNTAGVRYFEPVSAPLVQDQVAAVLEDLAVSHIKIGMVGSPEIARVLHEILADFSGEVIYDPVLAASRGPLLHREATATEMLDLVAERATVLTPNLAELEALGCRACPDPATALATAGAILKRFTRLRAVVVKGGHLEPQADLVTDHLIHRAAATEVITTISAGRPRIATANLHGTGCTHAAAFTAYHYLTNSYQQAFTLSGRFMDDLIRRSAGLAMGQGPGPLGHHLLNRERDKERTNGTYSE